MTSERNSNDQSIDDNKNEASADEASDSVGEDLNESADTFSDEHDSDDEEFNEEDGPLTLDDVEYQFEEQTFLDVQREDLAHLTVAQRLVYLLTARSIAHIAHARRKAGIIHWLFVAPWLGPVMYILMLLLMVVCNAAARPFLGAITDWMLYVIAFFAIIVTVSLRKDEERRLILVSSGYPEDWTLGRLATIARRDTLSDMLAFVGMVAGAQTGLICFSSNNLGIPNADTVDAAGLITADNFCRGVFLDFFDIYDLWLGTPVDHSIWSATVFFAFRCTMGAAIAFGVYSYIASFRLNRLLRKVPKRELKLPELYDWLDKIRGSRWSKEFPDEYIFLLAVREFLYGRYDEVRKLTARYPRLPIHDEVCQTIFTDEEGKSVIEGFRHYTGS